VLELLLSLAVVALPLSAALAWFVARGVVRRELRGLPVLANDGDGSRIVFLKDGIMLQGDDDAEMWLKPNGIVFAGRGQLSEVNSERHSQYLGEHSRVRISLGIDRRGAASLRLFGGSEKTDDLGDSDQTVEVRVEHDERVRVKLGRGIWQSRDESGDTAREASATKKTSVSKS